MFSNIQQKNKRRHNTLQIDKENINILEKSSKSIQFLKVNQIVGFRHLQEVNLPLELKQRKRTASQFNLRANSNSQIKFFQKMNPLRLERKSQLIKIAESTGNSSLQNQPQSQIKGLINSQFIQKSMENRMIMQYNSASFLIKMEDFPKMLQKICLNFLDAENLDDDFSYLNETLKNIKEAITNANKMAKMSKNRLDKKIHFFDKSQNYSNSINSSKDDFFNLILEKNDLLQELSELSQQKMSIMQYNITQVKEIQKKILQISQNKRQIEELEKKLIKLKENVDKEERRLEVVEAETDNIYHFVEKQSKNKLVQMASDEYKRIESQIYEYAVYLQANELANSLQYESLPTKYFKSIVQTLETSLKDINRGIIQNNEMNAEEKGKIMRDFVLKMHDAYQKKDCELQKALQFKTKCIIKFVDMMKKWLDNWTLKQEYLVHLRKSFAVDSISFEQRLKTVKDHVENAQFSQISNDQQALNDLYLKIKQNYLLGNSFY